MKHSAAWWAERVAEISKRGGVRAVARRHGVEESTLKWWRWELRRRSREAACASGSPRLLPVVVKEKAKPRPPSGSGSAHVELFVEVGPARLSMRGEILAEHVAAIVTAAARTC